MGPVAGIRVLELGGIGPAPFCGMVLADLGADGVRLDRPILRGSAAATATPDPRARPLDRGRRSVALDLKHPDGPAAALALAGAADVVIEGFRPGVAERLGVGPDECLDRNPGLVYGRVTGWGQYGPMADRAGHDINYLAVAGVLAHLGRADSPPVPPLNLVADFGGGGMLLAVGILAALLERGRSGRGQVVDAAMVDGAALLMTMVHGFFANGTWTERRGANLLDGGAPFYDSYETSDGRYVAIAANEPQFYARLVAVLGLADELPLQAQHDRTRWPAAKARIAEVFRSRTREQWCAAFDQADACFAPVLTMAEAYEHPHNRERGTFVTTDGVPQPAPAPRFSRTSPDGPGHVASPGEHTAAVFADWVGDGASYARWRQSGAVAEVTFPASH